MVTLVICFVSFSNSILLRVTQSINLIPWDICQQQDYLVSFSWNPCDWLFHGTMGIIKMILFWKKGLDDKKVDVRLLDDFSVIISRSREWEKQKQRKIHFNPFIVGSFDEKIFCSFTCRLFWYVFVVAYYATCAASHGMF